ncbi:hypothetical protein D3C77_397170 [compost metagenome]
MAEHQRRFVQGRVIGLYGRGNVALAEAETVTAHGGVFAWPEYVKWFHGLCAGNGGDAHSLGECSAQDF